MQATREHREAQKVDECNENSLILHLCICLLAWRNVLHHCYYAPTNHTQAPAREFIGLRLCVAGSRGLRDHTGDAAGEPEGGNVGVGIGLMLTVDCN